MTDTTLDALLEAVRFLLGQCDTLAGQDEFDRWDAISEKLDALIAQRKGRPDDQPAR